MPYLKSSEGLGNRPQRLRMIDDGRTAAQAGSGTLSWKADQDIAKLVNEDGVWIDISQDPSYTSGGNFIGDGSDG